MPKFRLLLLAVFVSAVGCFRVAPEPPPPPPEVAVAEARVEPAPQPPPRLFLASGITERPEQDDEIPVAPMPRPVTKLPVAPMPHKPGNPLDIDLTVEDPGLDPKIEAALPEIVRPKTPVVPDTYPEDIIGLPDLKPPGIPNVLPPGLGKEPPLFPGRTGADVPNAKFPGPYASRSGATKAKLIKEHGGNAESEKAVALGLAWLAKQQKNDGGWEFDQGSKEERAAATGLVLQAFLAAGETHKAPDKEKEDKDAKDERKYTKTVALGVGYLMKQCQLNGANAGCMSKNMYAQAIATNALVEAYAMTKDAALRPIVQVALNYLQKAQGPNGSWGYGAGQNGDTSITGWVVQALSNAQQTKDLVVDDKVLKRAIKFLDSVAAGKNKAEYGYSDSASAKAGTALTASGLWQRVCIDSWTPGSAGIAEGLEGLLKNPPKGTGAVSGLYYYQYATQVVRFCGGEKWKDWNEGPKGADGTRKNGVRDWLVNAQITKEGANLGSWDPEAGFIGQSCGRVGTTAVCVLQLEVYYRYLPLMKKKEEPKDDK